MLLVCPHPTNFLQGGIDSYMSDPCLCVEHNTVFCHIRKNVRHIIRNHIISSLQKCPCFCQPHACDRATRTYPQLNVSIFSGSLHQLYDIFCNMIMHINLFHILLHLPQLSGRRTGCRSSAFVIVFPWAISISLCRSGYPMLMQVMNRSAVIPEEAAFPHCLWDSALQ